jgi:hypothetical protein
VPKKPPRMGKYFRRFRTDKTTGGSPSGVLTTILRRSRSCDRTLI